MKEIILNYLGGTNVTPRSLKVEEGCRRDGKSNVM